MAAYFLNPASEAKLFKLFTFTERIIADFYETVRERQLGNCIYCSVQQPFVHDLEP